MKISYNISVLLLLFLLLLVQKSHSLPPSLGKELLKEIGKVITEQLAEKAVKNVWGETIEKINISLTKPDVKVVNIPGLDQVKQHLSRFGYLSQYSRPFDNVLDESTVSAIKKYQQYFNLPVTSKLDSKTLGHISLPRCGVPDIFRLSLNPLGVLASWPPKGKLRWLSRAAMNNLTYGLDPVTIPRPALPVFRNAFSKWSESMGRVNLVEARYEVADIQVAFYNFYDTSDDSVLGDSVVQSSNMRKTGRVRLDGNKYWGIRPTIPYPESNEQGYFDLETVVMHQIGHLLGLQHTSNVDSIMYPSILPSKRRKVQISNSDKNNIHQLYPSFGNYGWRTLPTGSGSGLGPQPGSTSGQRASSGLLLHIAFDLAICGLTLIIYASS